MADTAIAAQVDSNAGLSTIGKYLGMQSAQLGIAQQRQALQTGQARQEYEQSVAAQQAQKTREMQAGVPLISDPVGSGILDKDGNVTNAAQSVLQKAMPTTWSEHYDNFIKAAQTKLEYTNASNNLTQAERGQLISAATGAAADKNSGPEDAIGRMNDVVASMQGTPDYKHYATMADALQKTIKSANQQDPTGMRWRTLMLQMERGNLAPSQVVGAGGIGAPSASTVDIGGQIQPGTTQPALMGGAFQPTGAPIQKTIAPQIVTLPNRQLGPAGGQYGVPSTGTAQAPPPQNKLQPLTRPSPNAPSVDQENYNSQIDAAGKHMQAVMGAANDPKTGVQAMRFNNQQILDLIPHAATGPGLHLLNLIASRMPGESGDAYQVIEHFTAQNSAALARTMGVPSTNLGQETGAAAAGSVEKNPKALASIVKTNDALNTGFDLYNRGLAKVTNNGSDMSRVNAYKQAFGQNMDVNALRWADAHRRNDPAEIAAIDKQLGPKGIAAAQQKLRVLKSLAENGDMP